MEQITEIKNYIGPPACKNIFNLFAYFTPYNFKGMIHAYFRKLISDPILDVWVGILCNIFAIMEELIPGLRNYIIDSFFFIVHLGRKEAKAVNVDEKKANVN